MEELTYSGTAKGFLKFIDPFLRNTVQNMTRKVKKHTTCRHPNCNKRKYLEAAHTKFTRPEIISKILNEHFECEENMYTVDLEEFEKLFKEAHEPIEEVIQPMCRQHHIEYDKNKKIPTEYPVL